MPLQFKWSEGAEIQGFRVAKGRHVGTTHRLITQRSPGHTYHCVQKKTAADTVGTTGTSAHGDAFSAQYAISEPLTPPAKLAPIRVVVDGTVQPDGALTLRITHGAFPSGGVRVTENGKTVFTAIFNDASCVDALGPTGATNLFLGLSIRRATSVYHVPLGGRPNPPPARSPLCGARQPTPTPPARHARPLPKLIAGTYSGIKPSDIFFSGDAGNIVSTIKWAKWTRTSAVGHGTSNILGCVPSCAQGTATPVATSVTLSKPRDGHFTKIIEVRAGQKLVANYGRSSWPEGAQQ